MHKSAKFAVFGLGLPLLAWAASAWPADLYRCERKDGPAVYSDHSCGKDAVVVGKVPETPTRAAPAAGGDDVNVNVEVNNNIQLAAPPVSQANELRGLPFEVFRRLDRGMSEGEILAIAGAPERETVDAVNTRNGTQTKSYYYVSEGRNANVTRIEFTNGTVTNIDRKLAPY